MNILRPLMRHTSPSRTARVRIAATSDPASGSVIAIAPILVPAIAGRSQRSRWSSVPNSASAGVAMSDCTEIAIGIAPAPHRASSSTKTMPGREVAVAATPTRRIVEAEEPELAAAPKECIGKASRRLPLLDVRAHLGVDEAPHRGPQFLVLGREDRVTSS